MINALRTETTYLQTPNKVMETWLFQGWTTGGKRGFVESWVLSPTWEEAFAVVVDDLEVDSETDEVTIKRVVHSEHLHQTQGVI